MGGNRAPGIGEWLATIGLDQYLGLFARHGIDVDALPGLTDDDLRELGIPLGHRTILLEAVSRQRPGEAPPEPQRRQLTVVFCDMVGSTALSDRMDPEDLREVIRFYQDLCEEIVARHGGFVAQYQGDGILIYFGYPHAYEDATERAIRAGLEMIQAVDAAHAPHAVRIRVRLGAATGVMVVGDLIGRGANEHVAVTGRVPNIAARLQGVAGQGEIVIADETRKLIGGLFECQDLSTVALKGIDQDMRVWRVIRECGEAERFEALRGPRRGRFVGREHELSRMAEIFSLAAEGAGQVILLRGDAGIGKSSAMRAFTAALGSQPYVRITLQCSPNHVNTPLHPLIVHLRRWARFEPGDGDEARLRKIGEMLPPDRREDLDLIATLLSVPFGAPTPKPTQTPKVLKARTLDVVADHTISLAEGQPLVILVEDAHWIDPTSEELASVLLDRAAGRPVFVVISARPPFEPPWLDRSNVTVFDLGPLGEAEVKQLIGEVAGGAPLEPRVVAQILAKSEGVPLFAEELTRNQVEAQSDDMHEGAVPLTLRDSLMARLDRLGDTKSVAQVAAALGRRFSLPMLSAVTGHSQARLVDAIDRLLRSELVVEHRGPPHAEYGFKHALVQDAAYASLLRAEQRRLHGAIARALETSFPELVETEPETAAHHFARAGLGEDAARHWLRAGQRAIAASANAEAIGHLELAQAALAASPDGPARRLLEFNLQLALGQAFYVAKGPAAEQTQRAYERAQNLVEAVADPEHRYMLLYGIFAGYHFASRFDLAEGPAYRALELATKEGDNAYLCQAHRMLGYIHFFRGESAMARDHFMKLAALYEPGVHGRMAARFGADCLSASMGFRAVLECMCGKPDTALRTALTSLEDARRLGHGATIGWASAALSYVHFYRRDPEAGLRTAVEGLQFCEANSIASWAAHCRVFRLWAQAHQSGTEVRIEDVREAIATAAATNALGVPLLRTVMAEICSLLGSLPEAVEATGLAIEEIASHGQQVFLPLVLHVRGTSLQQLRGPSDAEARACFVDSQQAARRIGARLIELRAANSLSRLAVDSQGAVGADRSLGALYEGFDEGFDTRDLREARELIRGGATRLAFEGPTPV